MLPVADMDLDRDVVKLEEKQLLPEKLEVLQLLAVAQPLTLMLTLTVTELLWEALVVKELLPVADMDLELLLVCVREGVKLELRVAVAVTEAELLWAAAGAGRELPSSPSSSQGARPCLCCWPCRCKLPPREAAAAESSRGTPLHCQAA